MKSRTFLPTTLIAALVLPFPGWTQQANSPTPAQEVGGLKIVVIEGEGALNRIKAPRRATQPVVEVRDDSDKPVAGAEVVFQLPGGGPGAVFYPGMRTQLVKTDSNGRAVATGMTPNDEVGRFHIKVVATQGAKTASSNIAQTNTPNGGQMSRDSNHRKLYVVLGVVAVGAIAGGVAASRSGSGTPAVITTTPVSISTGPITVGGPR